MSGRWVAGQAGTFQLKQLRGADLNSMGLLLNLDHRNDRTVRLHGLLDSEFNVFPQWNKWQRGKQGREIYRYLANWSDWADSELIQH